MTRSAEFRKAARFPRSSVILIRNLVSGLVHTIRRSSGYVRQLRIREESTHLCWHFLKAPEDAQRDRLHFSLAAYGRATDPIMLHVFPDPFIGIQLGRVRRKEEKAQLPPGLLHEFFCLPGSVHRAAIDNEKDLAFHIVHQLLAELDEVSCPEAALVKAEPQFPARAHRRYHRN